MAAISDMSVPVGPQGSLLVAVKVSQQLGHYVCGVHGRNAASNPPGKDRGGKPWQQQCYICEGSSMIACDFDVVESVHTISDLDLH